MRIEFALRVILTCKNGPSQQVMIAKRHSKRIIDSSNVFDQSRSRVIQARFIEVLLDVQKDEADIMVKRLIAR